MDTVVKATPPVGTRVAVPATGREHVGTVLFGLWMTVGLFLDGYFHQNLGAGSDGESFATPWHAVFYAGFIASALWLAAMSRRRAAAGSRHWRLSDLPPGYDGARIGLALFGLGGLGDAMWHSAFGVERGIDALLSPTHLLLFVGLILILTAPARAAHLAPDRPPQGWVLAGSVIAATALVGFFSNFVWGLGIAALTRVPYDPVTGAGEVAVIAGVGSTLVTTVVLFAAARALLAGSPPPGALAVLFGVVALLVSLAFDEDAEGVAAAIAAGATLEVALRIRGVRLRGGLLPAAFAAAATVLWLSYLGLLATLDGIAWEAEIWLGAIVLNALVAAAIATATGHRTATTAVPEESTP